MTYEKYKTGTFRVSVFLTIILWAILGMSGDTKLFGNYFDAEVLAVFTPIFVWGTYYASLWIVKGYIGKK
jgi:hypothetical protein